MNLYEVLESLDDEVVLHDERNECDITVHELTSSGHSDLTESAVLENGEIFFATDDGEAIDPSEPAYSVK